LCFTYQPASRSGPARGIDAPVNAAISRLVGLLEATWTGRVNRLHPELP